jgi:isohexenylglutaconyl-CoA hydratase
MTALPETKSVDLGLENGWLTVWFNQPERRNPLTDDVVDDLEIISPRCVMIVASEGVTFRGPRWFFLRRG